MHKRILVYIGDLVDITEGDEHEASMWRELRRLVDELNSALAGYEVTLLHLDTADYIAFIKRDPTEGAYWRDLEEELRETAEVLFPGKEAVTKSPDH